MGYYGLSGLGILKGNGGEVGKGTFVMGVIGLQWSSRQELHVRR